MYAVLPYFALLLIGEPPVCTLEQYFGCYLKKISRYLFAFNHDYMLMQNSKSVTCDG